MNCMEPVLEPLYESAACQPALTANEESCERVAVNQGGTAELFGPFFGESKGPAFFVPGCGKTEKKITWNKDSTKIEKEKRNMAKEKLVKNITSRDEDFAQWYTDVVREANLCDYSSVKGCMNYLPRS